MATHSGVLAWRIPGTAGLGCRLWGRTESDTTEVTQQLSSSKHLFMCLLAICMSSLEKCLFSSLAHFWIRSFTFLVLSCMSCLYILEINSLSVVSFAIIFSHSEGYLFTLLIVSFVVQKLLSLIRSYYSHQKQHQELTVAQTMNSLLQIQT